MITVSVSKALNRTTVLNNISPRETFLSEIYYYNTSYDLYLLNRSFGGNKKGQAQTGCSCFTANQFSRSNGQRGPISADPVKYEGIIILCRFFENEYIVK